jgi:hypothetical protein
MDIGVWMNRETLQEKLALRREANPEGAWNLRRWPSGFVEGEENRLFVASQGAWRGYFKMTDALWNREDRDVPYTLLFDSRTWTHISPVPAPRFRGFTYKVPALVPTASGTAAASDRPDPSMSKSTE